MGWLSKVLGTDERNQRLAAWGQSVPVSPPQSRAMRAIWVSAKAGTPPTSDPLSELSEADRSYILGICGADYRPAEFGSADIHRVALYKTLLSKGFREDHAAVAVGMTFNMVGPTDL